MAAQAAFKRVDHGRGGRRYELGPPLVPKKVALTSVTSILSGGLPKPALKAWGEKLVAEAAVDQHDVWSKMERADAVDWLKKTSTRHLKKAATRGTNIHAAAELVVAGADPGDSIHAVYVHEFLNEWAASIDAGEQTIVNLADGWAGTTDVVFTDRQGKRWLGDWKTGKGVYADQALQLAAYARGEQWVVFDDDDDPRLEPAPRIDRLAILHLTDDGITVHEPIADIDTLYEDFRAVLRVHRAQKENKLIELKHAPRPEIPEYISYLLGRCRWAQECDARFGVSLRERWDASLPKLKDGTLTYEQCEMAESIISQTEQQLGIPFGPSRPWQMERSA